MKYIKTLIILVLAAALFLSCKPAAQKEMTPELFLQIQNEVLASDLTQASKEAISQKYGFTLQQYTDYEKLVETDEELKAKLGEARLKIEKDKAEVK